MAPEKYRGIVGCLIIIGGITVILVFTTSIHLPPDIQRHTRTSICKPPFELPCILTSFPKEYNHSSCQDYITMVK